MMHAQMLFHEAGDADHPGPFVITATSTLASTAALDDAALHATLLDQLVTVFGADDDEVHAAVAHVICVRAAETVHSSMFRSVMVISDQLFTVMAVPCRHRTCRS